MNGRNAVCWDERFKLDVWIMLLTLWKVVRREGITEAGEATMTEFGLPRPPGHAEL